MQLRIAVISDLHVGDARGQDLNPDSSSSPPPQVEDYLDRFETFINRESITADYLIVPGDVSNGAQAQQVDIASEALLRCASTLSVESSNILFVPGNHDVDYSVLKDDDPTGHYWSQRYNTLKRDSIIFSTICHSNTHSLFTEPYLYAWKDDNLLVFGYNTSWNQEPNDDVHHGTISDDHLDILEQQVSSKPIHDSRLRLFTLHHHPVIHSDIGQVDFSTLHNADRLMSLLHQYEFDIVVHGHKHRPRERAHYEGIGRHILVICAGSFSAQLNTYPDPPTNKFHLLRITGRDETTGNVHGQLKTWSFTVRQGWIKSERHHGRDIEHNRNFGLYLTVQEAMAEIQPVLEELLSTYTFVEWSSITDRKPKLKRLPNEQKHLALEKLSDILGLRVRHDDSGTILLR